MIVAVSLLFSLVAPAAAQDATPETGASLLAELGYPELRVTSDGATSDLPTELEAGRYHVILENQGEVDIDLEFYQLPEGITIEDLEAFFAEVAEAEGPEFAVPDFFYDMVFNGGATSFPGETGEVVLDLVPGEWVVNLLTSDPETDEQTDSLQTLTVTGEMPEIADPANAVDIEMAEMYFNVPDTIAAGPQIWHVFNSGFQIHHLILSSVPEGTTKEDVAELAAAFAGPPASPEAGATPVMPALSFEDVQDVFYTLLFSNEMSNWYELDLEPGTYAMICFMPDPSGVSHVMLGMIEVFTIE